MPEFHENKRGEIAPEIWKNSRFGKLRMKNPGAFTRASGRKVIRVCDCGKEALKSIIDVTRGHVKSCGKCNKSGLRKRGQERDSPLTEAEMREAQGYRKIWDLGKKRWVWTPKC
jgi:hypothetical protein